MLIPEIFTVNIFTVITFGTHHKYSDKRTNLNLSSNDHSVERILANQFITCL